MQTNKTIQAHTIEIKGKSYDIGYAQGMAISAIPAMKEIHTAGFKGFDSEEVKRAQSLFGRFCPGLNEELAGFADALKAAPEQIVYFAMTFLRPNCSHMVIHPQMTENGHILLARNYEFSNEAEDFILARTSVDGKYTHIGTSVLNFGREDGFNEAGLAITMSSCGFPVGAPEYMRRPAIEGLQYWAVIRTLLENCRNIDEALDMVRDMPVAYNLNLIAADKSGSAILIETLDGRLAFHRLDPETERYLHATNHAVIPELAALEPAVMEHSAVRYDYIKRTLDTSGKISKAALKSMLLSNYPDGLCCRYYQEFFGTTKSMVIDPVDGIIDLCWGGSAGNGWNSYSMSDPFEEGVHPVTITNEKAAPSVFQYITHRSTL